MRQDLDLRDRGRILEHLFINDLNQAPVRQELGDSVSALQIVLREVGVLPIQQEQLLEVYDVVSALLMKNVTRLVELVLIARGDPDASQCFSHL